MTQLQLKGTPAPEHRLTERQAFALEVIARLGPISSRELGGHMHERRDKHVFERACVFCESEGLAVARELRSKKDARNRGLVKQSRAGWTLTVRRTADPGVIPF